MRKPRSKRNTDRNRKRDMALLKIEYEIARYRNEVLEAAAQIAERWPYSAALMIRAAKDAVLDSPPPPQTSKSSPGAELMN